MPPEERIYATTSDLAKWIGNTEVVKIFLIKYYLPQHLSVLKIFLREIGLIRSAKGTFKETFDIYYNLLLFYFCI